MRAAKGKETENREKTHSETNPGGIGRIWARVDREAGGNRWQERVSGRRTGGRSNIRMDISQKGKGGGTNKSEGEKKGDGRKSSRTEEGSRRKSIGRKGGRQRTRASGQRIRIKQGAAG